MKTLYYGRNFFGQFSTPVHTLPGAQPVSYTVGTRSFPEVKRQGRDVDTPYPQSSAEVKETVKLYLSFPTGPSWAVIG